MELTFILADFAAAENGKLTVVGGGWTMCPPGHPHGLGLIIETGWGEANQPHHVELELIDADGQPFTDSVGNPVHAGFDFEVGRPPGMPIGSALAQAVAINVQVPTVAGQRYEWVASIDGKSKPTWRRSFSVLARSPQPTS